MDLTERIAEALGRVHDEGRDPGSALCVITADGAVHEAEVGDRGDGTAWTADTLAMTYSCAKPMAALAVLSVVAAGELGLDEPVARIWPEYAQAGKEETTVRHVLSHQAGLPAFPESAEGIAFDDREALVASLAAAAPVHRPGAAVAEHAYTYGHLCDELVRRATGEPLDEVFARIAVARGWDLHLRVPDMALARVADVVALDPGWRTALTDHPTWGPAIARPDGLRDPDVLNSRRFRQTCFAAISLHASARGLARFYADLLPVDGPIARMLGHELHAEYLRPQRTGHDLVLDREVAWTPGFQVDVLSDGRTEIGMGGAGGSAGWVTATTEGEPAFATGYVSRGLGDFARLDEVWQRLGL